MLKCEGCGREFEITEAELHDAEMTHITIGCPDCSEGITYHRCEGD